MNQSDRPNYTELLQKMMDKVGVNSFNKLSQVTGVSRRQIDHLRQGEVSQMRIETLIKLSEVLQLSGSQLLNIFSSEAISNISSESENSALKQEYQRLQQQLYVQREMLIQEFQEASLQIIESWLVQWPTAAYSARQNEQLPAVRLLPLIQPIEELMAEWGVTAIASVGEEVPYNPQLHQLMSGTAQSGDMARVRYTGYRHGDKLLYRAKVSPI
jgi:transcriptional regulator with XRE-family HTH domain